MALNSLEIRMLIRTLSREAAEEGKTFLTMLREHSDRLIKGNEGQKIVSVSANGATTSFGNTKHSAFDFLEAFERIEEAFVRGVSVLGKEASEDDLVAFVLTRFPRVTRIQYDYSKRSVFE